MTGHVAESGDETLFVRDGAGPFADAHARRGIAVTPRRCTPLGYLESLELLGPDMLIAHAVEADDKDMDRLQLSRTFVAHCPKSNAKLRHSVARVRTMRDRGISVSLGTDSIASNDSIDMFQEMRAAMSHGLTATEVFQMATLEGARALSLDHQLGSLEVGKLADCVVVELGPASDPLDRMLSSPSATQIRSVFLAGREVSLDNSELWKRAEPVIKRLRE